MAPPWADGRYVEYMVALAEVKEMQRDLNRRKLAAAKPRRKPARAKPPTRLPPIDSALASSRSEPDPERIRWMAGDKVQMNSRHVKLAAELLAAAPRKARPVAIPTSPEVLAEEAPRRSPFRRNLNMCWDEGLRG